MMIKSCRIVLQRGKLNQAILRNFIEKAVFSCPLIAIKTMFKFKQS